MTNTEVYGSAGNVERATKYLAGIYLEFGNISVRIVPSDAHSKAEDHPVIKAEERDSPESQERLLLALNMSPISEIDLVPLH